MGFGRLGARGGLGGLGIASGGTTSLILSGSTFTANSAIGTVVGTLSVAHGSGSYTYSLTSNPGALFSISGNQLQLASATIAAGSYPITVQANNGAGSVVSRAFMITAIPAGGSVFLAMDMSDFRNTYILGL